MKTTQLVESIVRDTVSSMGFELDEVEYLKEYGVMVLTLYIDSPNGVTLEDCERVSRAVEPILDEKDPIAEQYYLSVSSIGLDRPLKKDKDYERNMGKKLQVKLYVPMDKKKELLGTLIAFDGQSLTLELEGGKQAVVLRKDAALVKPWIDFSQLGKTEPEQ